MSNTIGSPFTDAGVVSRLGQQAKAGDALKLFLTEFGGMVITSYEETMSYGDMTWDKSITQGKSDTFPIIGRKRDAQEHVVGAEVIGGSIAHDQVEISVDPILFESLFIAEFDELLNHYDVRGPYATQLAQSLASTTDKRVAQMHILASRMYDSIPVPNGQPAPGYFVDVNLKTSASAMETAAFASKRYLLENDISGQEPRIMLPWQQYLLFARNFGVESQRETGGSGSKVTGKVGQAAGLSFAGTNHMPQTNISTGNTKYRGDFSAVVGHCSTKNAVGKLKRMGLRMSVIPRPERFGTLLIASLMEGHGQLRGECCIEWRNAVKTGTVNSVNITA